MAVSVLGLAGCASHNSEQSTTAYKADRQLATDVAESLNKSSGYAFPDVAVKANGGQVELRGFVSNEAQKDEAGRIASQVPGVSRVDNDLAIRPGPQGAPAGGATAP